MSNLKILYFGLDYLRFSVFGKVSDFVFLNQLFFGLSKNSPYTQLNILGVDFGCRYIETRLDIILMLDHKNLPIGNITRCSNSIKKDLIFKVDFWGTAFVYKNLIQFIKNFETYLKGSYKISRIDLALDLNCSIIETLKGLERNNYKGNTYYSGKGEIETQYLGKKGNNKRHFVRVYNKKKDIELKSKINVYLDYFKQKHVTRIECQINSDSCNTFGIDFNILDDFDFQKNIFNKICFNKRINYFQILNKLNFQKSNIISKSKRKLDFSELHTTKMFLSYARKLKENGINPLDIL